MKEIYKCTPTELDEQPESTLKLHWEIWQMEKKENYLNEKRKQQRSKK